MNWIWKKVGKIFHVFFVRKIFKINIKDTSTSSDERDLLQQIKSGVLNRCSSNFSPSFFTFINELQSGNLGGKKQRQIFMKFFFLIFLLSMCVFNFYFTKVPVENPWIKVMRCCQLTTFVIKHLLCKYGNLNPTTSDFNTQY